MRLAGLYTLERLAQNNPGQRQTIVNVLCAYLRMPYTLPDDPPRDHAIRNDVATQHRDAVEVREVRLTAQRVLTAHLRPGDEANPADTFWADTDLDLTGAVLIKLDLHRCHLRTARFVEARFVGHAWFHGATFAGQRLVPQHLSLHHAMAGRTVTAWADLRSVHISLAGHVVRTVTSRLRPETCAI